MSTVQITTDAAPAVQGRSGVTTLDMRFKPTKRASSTLPTTVPAGTPVVVLGDGYYALYASIGGHLDYTIEGVTLADFQFTDFTVSDLDPAPSPAARALAAPVPAGLAPWALPAWADDVTVTDDFVLLSHVAGVTKCRPPFTDRQDAGLLVTVESSVELVTIDGIRYARPPASPYLRIEVPLASEVTVTPKPARALAELLLTAADLAAGVAA